MLLLTVPPSRFHQDRPLCALPLSAVHGERKVFCSSIPRNVHDNQLTQHSPTTFSLLCVNHCPVQGNVFRGEEDHWTETRNTLPRCDEGSVDSCWLRVTVSRILYPEYKCDDQRGAVGCDGREAPGDDGFVQVSKRLRKETGGVVSIHGQQKRCRPTINPIQAYGICSVPVISSVVKIYCCWS